MSQNWSEYCVGALEKGLKSSYFYVFQFTFKFWTSGGGNEIVFWQCGIIWFEVLIIWAELFDIGLEFWDFILQKPKFSKPEAKSLLLQSN